MAADPEDRREAVATIGPDRGTGAYTGPRRPEESTEIDKRARRALRLLESEASRAILSELGGGPLTVTELERRLHIFAPTTLRNHRRHLTELGVLTRVQRGGVSREVTCELTRAGGWLDNVRAVVLGWLGQRPERPIEADGPEVTVVVKAVVRGWCTGIIQRLAHGPHRLAELEKVCGGVSKRELQTRLAALTRAELVERMGGGDNHVVFGLTRWGRRVVAPIAAAARWDRAHVPEKTAPMIPGDVVAALVLGLGLIELRGGDSGVFELIVEPDRDADGAERAAQVHAVIEGGEIVSFAAGPAESPTSWATGSPAEWFDAIVESRPDALRTGGERELVEGIVRGLHRELVEVVVRGLHDELASGSARRY